MYIYGTNSVQFNVDEGPRAERDLQEIDQRHIYATNASICCVNFKKKSLKLWLISGYGLLLRLRDHSYLAHNVACLPWSEYCYNDFISWILTLLQTMRSAGSTKRISRAIIVLSIQVS